MRIRGSNKVVWYVVGAKAEKVFFLQREEFFLLTRPLTGDPFTMSTLTACNAFKEPDEARLKLPGSLDERT